MKHKIEFTEAEIAALARGLDFAETMKMSFHNPRQRRSFTIARQKIADAVLSLDFKRVNDRHESKARRIKR